MPILNLRKKLASLVLIGNHIQFPLEGRIFHGISIGLIILTSIYVPYNLYVGLYVGAISAFLCALFFSYQYYNSRFRGNPHNNTLFGIFGIIIFGSNYFTNSGINGSTDLIWPVYLLLVLAISPYQQHLKWLLIYLVFFMTIHAIEFYNPNLILHPFIAGKGQFLDRITIFPIPVISIYVIIRYIRRSYDKERQITQEKSLAVEISNEKISLQKDQLAQSNIEKSKLMSIISHDLRAPLVNIKSYLELLAQNEIASDEKPMLEKALLKSTSAALEMLSNLLNWSKSQMGGTILNLTEINLSDSLLSTLEMQQIHASTKEIKLTYSIPPQLIVNADLDMLQLVLRNLISNAIKFTAKGGSISIDANEIANECKITITDTGIGIPEVLKSEIFSIKSVASYGTNNEKGVGLGLVLCKEFIENQGGRISFESIVGKGSSFYIFLSLKK